MTQQIHSTSQIDPLADEEYEYRIDPAAIETLINVLLKHGVDLRGNHYDGGEIVFFTTRSLIDLKKLKDLRIVRSYTITKVTRNRQTIEQG